MAEGVLVQSAFGRRGSYRICDVEGCRTFLAQRYSINGNLEEWIEMMSRQEAVSRAEQVAMAGNSKARKARGFKGFLVNSYVPIEASLCEEVFVIYPVEGTSVFIEDYEHFRIPDDVVVIGMENGENFQRIRGQQYLFDDLKVLFVSRYPQSTDLRTWLQMIPNRYIHKFIPGILHVIKPTVTILQPFLYICRNKELRTFSQKSVKLSLKDFNPR